MVALLLSLALLLPARASAPLDDCGACKPTALCATHQAEEDAAVQEFSTKLKSKDAFLRQSTVEKLAALDAKHPLAPSAAIAKLVAAQLEDEAFAVRTAAAKALGDGLHPDVAIVALADALEASRKELAKIPFGPGDWGPPPGQKKDGGAPPDPKAAERRKLREDLGNLQRTAIGGLAKLPDDRAVAALAEQLPALTRWNGDAITTTTRALLEGGSRKGVEAIVAKLKSFPVGDAAPKWGGRDPSGRAVRDLLAAYAVKRGCDEVPDWNDKEQVDWDKWLAKNQKKFEPKLGKYGLDELRKRAEGGAAKGS